MNWEVVDEIIYIVQLGDAKYHVYKIGSTTSFRKRMRQYFTTFCQKISNIDDSSDITAILQAYKINKVASEIDELLKKDKNRGFVRFADTNEKCGTEIYECTKVCAKLEKWFLNKNIGYKKLSEEEVRSLYYDDEKIKFAKSDIDLVPKQHQTDVFESIYESLVLSNSTQIRWTCGSGKTLLVLFFIKKYAEALNFKKIIIGVSSRIIRKQFWENIDKLAFKGELDIDVICYKSSYKHVSAEYCLKIADEAHHIANISSEDDSNRFIKFHEIKARKSIYMTATPKFIISDAKIEKKSITYSMDDEKYFGNVAAEFSAKRAIEGNLITDFNVELIPGEENMVEWAASVIEQIKNETKSRELRHLIVYMKNVEETDRLLGLIQYDDEYSESAISAVHSKTKNISMILSEYAESKFGVLIVCDILGEGVDIPIADTVIMARKMQSKIQIYQYLMRVNRLCKEKPKKKAKYIFNLSKSEYAKSTYKLVIDGINEGTFNNFTSVKLKSKPPSKPAEILPKPEDETSPEIKEEKIIARIPRVAKVKTEEEKTESKIYFRSVIDKWMDEMTIMMERTKSDDILNFSSYRELLKTNADRLTFEKIGYKELELCIVILSVTMILDNYSLFGYFIVYIQWYLPRLGDMPSILTAFESSLKITGIRKHIIEYTEYIIKYIRIGDQYFDHICFDFHMYIFEHYDLEVIKYFYEKLNKESKDTCRRWFSSMQAGIRKYQDVERVKWFVETGFAIHTDCKEYLTIDMRRYVYASEVCKDIDNAIEKSAYLDNDLNIILDSIKLNIKEKKENDYYGKISKLPWGSNLDKLDKFLLDQKIKIETGDLEKTISNGNGKYLKLLLTRIKLSKETFFELLKYASDQNSPSSLKILIKCTHLKIDPHFVGHILFSDISEPEITAILKMTVPRLKKKIENSLKNGYDFEIADYIECYESKTHELFLYLIDKKVEIIKYDPKLFYMAYEHKKYLLVKCMLKYNLNYHKTKFKIEKSGDKFIIEQLFGENEGIKLII